MMFVNRSLPHASGVLTPQDTLSTLFSNDFNILSQNVLRLSPQGVSPKKLLFGASPGAVPPSQGEGMLGAQYTIFSVQKHLNI